METLTIFDNRKQDSTPNLEGGKLKKFLFIVLSATFMCALVTPSASAETYHGGEGSFGQPTQPLSYEGVDDVDNDGYYDVFLVRGAASTYPLIAVPCKHYFTVEHCWDGRPGQIARLYMGLFDRTPDAEGIAFWTVSDGGTYSLDEVAQLFLDSPEFSSLGTLSNENFVKRMYELVLNRPEDHGGQYFWTNALNQGRYSRANVLRLFAESPENIGRRYFEFEGWQFHMANGWDTAFYPTDLGIEVFLGSCSNYASYGLPCVEVSGYGGGGK